MTKKTKILGLVILAVLVLAAAGYFNFKWFPEKIAKIERGLASDKFPWRDFTQDELNKMYPQIKYADVPTRVTPEETYAKFREALRTNNLELALEQFADNSRSGTDAAIQIRKFYDENRFNELYKYYPEKIEKSWANETLAEYFYLEKNDNHNLRQSISFEKNEDGDWKMSSL